jgi:hypothetical protein
MQRRFQITAASYHAEKTIVKQMLRAQEYLLIQPGCKPMEWFSLLKSRTAWSTKARRQNEMAAKEKPPGH